MNKKLSQIMKMSKTIKALHELQDLGVIRIDKKGKIHQTRFGMQVYNYMIKHKMFVDKKRLAVLGRNTKTSIIHSKNKKAPWRKYECSICNRVISHNWRGRHTKKEHRGRQVFYKEVRY